MAKISINLLPSEIIAEEGKRTKFYKIQLVGITIILFMIFLTSLTFALQILQSHNILLYQTKLTQAQEKISNLKSTQASLFLLKNRITVIGQYLEVPSEQSFMYRMIEKLAPKSVLINSITIGRNGEAVFLALAPDPASLDNLINSLTVQEKNEGKIGQVSIENLNRGRDGMYRISLKILPK